MTFSSHAITEKHHTDLVVDDLVRPNAVKLIAEQWLRKETEREGSLESRLIGYRYLSVNTQGKQCDTKELA